MCLTHREIAAAWLRAKFLTCAAKQCIESNAFSRLKHTRTSFEHFLWQVSIVNVCVREDASVSVV